MFVIRQTLFLRQTQNFNKSRMLTVIISLMSAHMLLHTHLYLCFCDCECMCDLQLCVYFRASGAMANASPDLDNAEAQRQLNNNNRPISSGFWETECTSSKLFECSRIKALAGQRSNADQHKCVVTSIQAYTLQTHLQQ